MSRILDNNYSIWLSELKATIQKSQIKAALSVNSELIELYWELGKEIIEKQQHTNWGSGFINQLSKDLQFEFPGTTGFSAKNLRYCRQFFNFYANPEIQQQVVAKSNSQLFWQQVVAKLSNTAKLNHPERINTFDAFKKILFQIPWGHHILIMQKNKQYAPALFYIEQTIVNSWSRSILEYNIDTALHKRQGNAITNFKNTLPAPDSDLAIQLLKDPYNFEFLMLEKSAKEKDLEMELTNNITRFLLELGQGFAYLGRQFTLKIGKKEYHTDLLFYDINLRRYIVVELKMQEFQPEFIGKLNFYISAINETLKTSADSETIGILLCKTKDNFEVEFSLKDINKPIGVSEYTYKTLPEEIKQALPKPEDLRNLIKTDHATFPTRN